MTRTVLAPGQKLIEQFVATKPLHFIEAAIDEQRFELLMTHTVHRVHEGRTLMDPSMRDMSEYPALMITFTPDDAYFAAVGAKTEAEKKYELKKACQVIDRYLKVDLGLPLVDTFQPSEGHGGEIQFCVRLSQFKDGKERKISKEKLVEFLEKSIEDVARQVKTNVR